MPHSDKSASQWGINCAQEIDHNAARRSSETQLRENVFSLCMMQGNTAYKLMGCLMVELPFSRETLPVLQISRIL